MVLSKNLGHFWLGYVKVAGTPSNECSFSEFGRNMKGSGSLLVRLYKDAGSPSTE